MAQLKAAAALNSLAQGESSPLGPLIGLRIIRENVLHAVVVCMTTPCEAAVVCFLQAASHVCLAQMQVKSCDCDKQPEASRLCQCSLNRVHLLEGHVMYDTMHTAHPAGFEPKGLPKDGLDQSGFVVFIFNALPSSLQPAGSGPQKQKQHRRNSWQSRSNLQCLASKMPWPPSQRPAGSGLQKQKQHRRSPCQNRPRQEWRRGRCHQ